MTSTPPDVRELEVSLFGPGIGESLVIHLGFGDWIVVDSCCRNRKSRVPIAVEYLTRLGVEPASAIRGVVATHWHDDHVGGLANLLQAAPAALFVCSQALHTREFYKLVESGTRLLTESAATDEFREVFHWLAAKDPERAARSAAGPDVWAAASRPIATFSEGRDEVATIVALSPSDDSITRFTNSVASELPHERDTKRRFSGNRHNEGSVVLQVTVGNIRLLLGADLEASSADREGWQAVLERNTPRPEPSHVLKIPHHGSVTAESSVLWEHLLIENPVAVMAPYTPSGIPRDSDLRRICKRTSKCYLTSSAHGRRPPRRDAAVEKMIQRFGVHNRRAVNVEMGHVRLRCAIGSDPTEMNVDLDHGAFSGCT